MRVAAVQLAPAYLDRDATLDIVVRALRDAAGRGAELVAFPETFVPGYPSWVDHTHASYFDHAAQKAAFARYLDHAVDVVRGDLDEVVDACAELGVFAYVGVYERSESGGSGYCSLVAIDPVDGIVSVHRKLKPTFGERLVWADGDGSGLVVHDHRGVRVSGLNCWENWMPLARTTMYAQGTQVHVATWPGSPGTSHDISRFIAREGRMFVVSSGAILRAEHLPDDFPLLDEMRASGDEYATGGAIIVGPDGEMLAEGAPRGSRASSSPTSTSICSDGSGTTSIRPATTPGPTCSICRSTGDGEWRSTRSTTEVRERPTRSFVDGLGVYVPGMVDVRAGHYAAGIAGAALLRHWFRDGAANERRVGELEFLLAGLDDAPLSTPMNPERRELLEGYAEWSGSYDGANPMIEAEEPSVRAHLDELVGASTRALDAGCGTGRHAEHLAGLGAEVVGVDQSPEMLELARQKVPTGRFLEGRLDDLPLDDDAFDVAVSSLALCHLPDPAPALAELARVLRPGGRLVISDPHPASAQVGGQAFYGFGTGEPLRWVENHYHQASAWLRGFGAAGLDVVEVDELTFSDAQIASSPAAPVLGDALHALLDDVPSIWIWVVEAR